jgi:hypothetical protein
MGGQDMTWEERVHSPEKYLPAFGRNFVST